MNTTTAIVPTIAPQGCWSLQRPSYQDLVRDFLAGRNERTRRAYAQDLEDFRTFLGAATVDTAVRLLLALGVGNGE